MPHCAPTCTPRVNEMNWACYMRSSFIKIHVSIAPGHRHKRLCNVFFTLLLVCRRSSTTRPRHSSSVGTTLAACASTYHIQTMYSSYARNHVWKRAHGNWWTWWCLCHNLPPGLTYVQPTRGIAYIAHKHYFRIEFVFCRNSTSVSNLFC